MSKELFEGCKALPILVTVLEIIMSEKNTVSIYFGFS